jgi:hypothetical protein
VQKALRVDTLVRHIIGLYPEETASGSSGRLFLDEAEIGLAQIIYVKVLASTFVTVLDLNYRLILGFKSESLTILETNITLAMVILFWGRNVERSLSKLLNQ